jgi:hypothetical protein
MGDRKKKETGSPKTALHRKPFGSGPLTAPSLLDAETQSFFEARLQRKEPGPAAPASSGPSIPIGAVDDPFEREADQIADRMMRMPMVAAAPTQQPRATETGNPLQRKPASAASQTEAPPIVHEVLRSPGQPLDRSTRDFFEQRFSRDFSGVRIHTDSRAARSALAVNALAYTVGRHISFGQGLYNPRTTSGAALLAHELTHVVQQRALSPSGAFSGATLIQRDADPGAPAQAQQGPDPNSIAYKQGYDDAKNGRPPQRESDLSEDAVADYKAGYAEGSVLGSAATPGSPAQTQPPADASQTGAKADAGAPPPAKSDDQASRDRQVSCVISEGGCPSSRSGGLPSPEEMQNYNQKCKATSQYTGPDITPSEEECKNPPKPSPLPAAASQQGEWSTGEVVLVGAAVVVGAALIIVFAPELIPAAANLARGAVVALRIGAALAPALPAAAAGGEALVYAEVTASAIEAGTGAVEAGGVAARGAQVLNVVVRSAQPVAQAVQASAPAAQIAVTSSASTLAKAVTIITAAGVSAAALPSDSQTPEKKDDKKKKDCGDKPLFWDPVVSTSSSQPGLLDACFLVGDYSMHGHHTWPEYAGGLSTQPLMGVRGSVHISMLQPQLDAFLIAGFAKDGFTRSLSQNGPFIAHLRTDRALRRQMVAAMNSFYAGFNAAYCNPQIPPVIYQSGIGATLMDLGGP